MQLEVKSATTTTDQTAILGQSTGTTGKIYGVLGTTASTTANASGIKGIATGSTGNTNGVWGQSNSTTGSGVYGVNNGTTTGFGVFGEASTGNAVRGETSTGYGVVGSANGANGYGVFGQSIGTGGTNYGGFFTAINGTNNYGLVVQNGNAGVGTITPKEKLQVAGNTLVDNNVIAGQSIATGKMERQLYTTSAVTGGTFYSSELSNGFGATAISLFRESGGMKATEMKTQGVDIGSLLDNATSAWYPSSSSGWPNPSPSGFITKNSTTAADGPRFGAKGFIYSNCPDGYIATGWQAWLPSGTWLQGYLHIKCTKLANGYTTAETGSGVESVANSPHSDSPYSNINYVAACPPGTYLKGIYTKTDGSSPNYYFYYYLDAYCTGIKKTP